MPKVDLAEPWTHKGLLYGPGKGVKVPEEVAALIEKFQGERANEYRHRRGPGGPSLEYRHRRGSGDPSLKSENRDVGKIKDDD